MNKLEIIEADYKNKVHGNAILFITDQYARSPMGLHGPLPEKIKQNLIRELGNFPCSLSFIAFVNDEPAGVANCVYSFSTFRAKKIINVHDLAVISNYRSMGIGQALLAAVEKKAIETNCCKITLEVREDNRARSLYEREGFSYGQPAMLFMTKDLNQKKS